MRRLFKQTLAFCITAATLIFTGFPSALALSASQPEKITIAQYGHIFLYMPIYVAVDKGFFKEQGLDVKLVSTGGDEKTFTAIATGNAQFGVSDPVFVAIARQRGQGGKVVAGIVRRVPLSAVTFNNNIKTITKPSDFTGYRIAALTAPSTTYSVAKIIVQNNGHPIKSSIVQGAYGTLLAMLRANQADIALEIDPNVSTSVHQGAHIVYSTTSRFGDFAFTGMTVSDSFYNQHPEQIQAAVNAIAKAMKYIHQDFAGSLAVAKKEFPEIDEPILHDALKRMIDDGTTPISPDLTKEAWDRAVSLRKELGDLQGSDSYQQNVDMKFAQKIH